MTTPSRVRHRMQHEEPDPDQPTGPDAPAGEDTDESGNPEVIP